MNKISFILHQQVKFKIKKFFLKVISLYFFNNYFISVHSEALRLNNKKYIHKIYGGKGMKTLRILTHIAFTGILLLVVLIGGCGTKSFEVKTISIDGSSTVYPITEAVAEEFQKVNRSVRVVVGISGTGGGFKKFYGQETDISEASRPIKSSEAEKCKENNISFVELPVAYDGLAVMVHPENTWCNEITVAELKKLWEPEAQGKIMKWSDVRNGWPNEEIHLFGPGTDSGTFDYFTEAINGEEQACRGDFTSSEDDNVLVQGISSDKYGLGFFGLAYYEENQDKLKLVAIDDENDDNGKGAILPTSETVVDGTYQPLARPIFIYVRQDALDNRPEVETFVTFYLKQAPALVREVGYIPLPQTAYDLALQRVTKRMTGSVFSGGSKVGIKIEDLLASEGK